MDHWEVGCTRIACRQNLLLCLFKSLLSSTCGGSLVWLDQLEWHAYLPRVQAWVIVLLGIAHSPYSAWQMLLSPSCLLCTEAVPESSSRGSAGPQNKRVLALIGDGSFQVVGVVLQSQVHFHHINMQYCLPQKNLLT